MLNDELVILGFTASSLPATGIVLTPMLGLEALALRLGLFEGLEADAAEVNVLMGYIGALFKDVILVSGAASTDVVAALCCVGSDGSTTGLTCICSSLSLFVGLEFTPAFTAKEEGRGICWKTVTFVSAIAGEKGTDNRAEEEPGPFPAVVLGTVVARAVEVDMEDGLLMMSDIDVGDGLLEAEGAELVDRVVRAMVVEEVEALKAVLEG